MKMKKIRKCFLAILCVGIIFSANSSAFAWQDADIIAGDPDIIVPMQVPDIKYSFDIDDTAADHSGKTGNVFKGSNLNVSKPGQVNLFANIKGYKFNEGTYKISLWFKEDENNPDTMTRMWRPIIGSSSGGTTIRTADGGWFYYSPGASGVRRGEWEYLEMDFEVTSENANKGLLNDGASITLWWQCASENHSSKDISAPYTVYMSDLKLMKYPVDKCVLENVKPGYNEIVPAEESSAEFEFSFGIDPESVKYDNILINGVSQTEASVKFFVDDNTLVISREGGFAPDKSYNVEVTGLKDLWGREIAGSHSGTVTTKDYFDFKIDSIYNDSETANKVNFSLINNLNGSKDVRVVIVCYDGSNIKKLFSSDIITCMPGVEVKPAVDVLDLASYSHIRASVWEIINGGVYTVSKPIDMR